MDLIYADESRNDINVLDAYTLDLAFGEDENDFELQVSTSNHVCKAKYYIYMEDTEYGGIINDINVDTASKEITYYGDTWHGILAKKIIEPDDGEDYLYCDGEANSVLSELIDRLQLGELFRASSEITEIDISNYKMNRYINGYEGINKMLASEGAKLKISYKYDEDRKGYVELKAVPIVDYSQDEEFDSSQLDFDITKCYRPVNHVICLGKGELTERVVIHLYADVDGNISEVQSQTGLDDIVCTYDYTSYETEQDLIEGGIELLTSHYNADQLELSFDSNDESYDIGDIVGAIENTTGISMIKSIVKKIVKIYDGITQISYEVGD